MIDHMLCHKTSLGKFKEIEIIASIFSDHSTVRLEINYKKNKQTNKQTKKDGSSDSCHLVFLPLCSSLLHSVELTYITSKILYKGWCTISKVRLQNIEL